LDFPIIKEIFHTDVYDIIKHKFNMSRRSLGKCCAFFNIPAKQHPLEPDVWQDALIGEKKALNYVYEHNIEDVVCLETLYNKISKYATINNTSI